MHYSTTLKTAPTCEPVTVEQVLAQCRVDSHDETDLVASYIQSAREYAEQYTQRAFITQTWEWRLDRFPNAGGVLYVPRPALQSVSSITYVDTDGDTQTWSSDEYTVDIYSTPGRITQAYGYDWPIPRTIENAVTITLVAGYGDAATDVPEPIRHAVRLLAAHWFEHREPINVGNIVTPVPFTVESLLGQRRVMEWRR